MDLFYTKVAYAARFDDFLTNVNSFIINPLITLLFALAVAYFLWGMFEFILNQQNEEKKTTGKGHMLWGVIGIAIMMAVWAILGIILNTLNIRRDQIDPENNRVSLPNIPN